MTEKYSKLSDRVHVLKRPDTFIGSLEHVSRECLVWKDGKPMRTKQLECPALCSILDEILTNAQDRQYKEELRKIEISYDQESIVISNDGKGIPVEKIQVEGEGQVWIPELVFGHFRAGSNFDDDQIRWCGGRNGFGATLANVFSSRFVIEVGDVVNQKLYYQEWQDNMSKKLEPVIRNYTKKNGFVRVTFTPDWQRFGYTGFPDSLRNYIATRAWDVAACTKQQVVVKLNQERIPLKSFKQYATAVIQSRLNIEIPEVEASAESGEQLNDPYAYEQVVIDGMARLELAISYSDGFRAIGFVNGLRCSRGKHIDHIVKLACKALQSKSSLALKSAQLKSHMLIVCKAIIDNPSFESQTKECLATVPSKFGFEISFSDRFVKKLCSLPITASAAALASLSQEKTLQQSSRVGRNVSVAKLEDALHACQLNNGCALIITEGDSAKELAMAGLSEIGREKYGVYPLIGKILNPRNVSHEELLQSSVSMELMKVMGLEYGKVYNAQSLARIRYPRGLIAMTDQDPDGDHICSLLINWVGSLFPSIFEVDKFFVKRFISPITVYIVRREYYYFYTVYESDLFAKQCQERGETFTSRWLKGLAASTNADARRYFSNLDTHLVPLEYDPAAKDALLLVFDKRRADERKAWLRDYDPEAYVDYSKRPIAISEFLNLAQRSFSHEDCVRSLPAIDGFKPGQRKIVYAMLDWSTLTKCSDLQGDIGRRTCYHHNSDALFHAMVLMAQVHWCTNNINLVHGEGQFGSRLSSKYGQSRYLAAKIEPIARFLFPKADDPILDYQRVDGQLVEPSLFHCIIPWVLVNGASGIGTGWSTLIPPHNPLDLADWIECRLQGIEYNGKLQPWFEQFKGAVVTTENGWDVRGCLQVNGNRVLITELAPGYNKSDYIVFLEKCKVQKREREPSAKRQKLVQFIEQIQDRSTHTSIEIELMVDQAQVEQLEKPLADLLHLSNCKQSQFSSKNYVLIMGEKPQKFSSAEEICATYYPVRLAAYSDRLDWMRKDTRAKISDLLEKHRFISLVREKKVELGTSKKKLIETLLSLNFSDPKALLSVACSQFTTEKLQKLDQAIADLNKRLSVLEAQTPEKEWLADLEQFRAEYPNYLLRKQEVLAPSDQVIPKAQGKGKGKAKAQGKARAKAQGKARAKAQGKTRGRAEEK